MKKPTPAQQAILENIAAGRRPSDGLPAGRSHAAGFLSSWSSCKRNGWISHGLEFSLTAEGLKALESVK